MTCGLVHASYSLPEWQAVKLTFFAPWFNCICVFLSLFCMPLMLKLFFVYTQFEDQTAMFLSFVSKRHVDFSEKKDRHVRVIGQDAFDSLQYFYTAVKSVFEKGLTGGCRIIATKPALN